MKTKTKAKANQGDAAKVLECVWNIELERCDWGGAEASLLVAVAVAAVEAGERKRQWYGVEPGMVYRSGTSAAILLLFPTYISKATPAEATPSTRSASEVFSPAAPATLAKSVVPAISFTFVAQSSPQVDWPAL